MIHGYRDIDYRFDMENLVDILGMPIYGIKVAWLKDVQWAGKGQLKVGNYTIYFSGIKERYQ